MRLKTCSHNLLFELNRVIDPGFALGLNFHSVYVSTIHNGHKCTKPLSYQKDDITGRLPMYVIYALNLAYEHMPPIYFNL